MRMRSCTPGRTSSAPLLSVLALPETFNRDPNQCDAPIVPTSSPPAASGTIDPEAGWESGQFGAGLGCGVCEGLREQFTGGTERELRGHGAIDEVVQGCARWLA